MAPPDEIDSSLRSIERQLFVKAEERGHAIDKLFLAAAQGYRKDVLGTPQPPRARFELIQGGRDEAEPLASLAELLDEGGELVVEAGAAGELVVEAHGEPTAS